MDSTALFACVYNSITTDFQKKKTYFMQGRNISKIFLISGSYVKITLKIRPLKSLILGANVVEYYHDVFGFNLAMINSVV